ncbi:[FeFe] hydrogenase H-cluster radical SAM maturase HydG [Candidatus Formimonas warabiya]|uniref:[FeFe] hydrogenase H-cluster radical SAM maturase HydG n=1 Tax=Formimonas warabiya TaxID=1761012 RepID=A0A3G1KTN5_FORW1|nr:[FeFe] hydrogenase H-cluster radical SAM maturase HydG [Candidatus Formimonas warabiya]ATW25764.1 [FeFe] hydrogenase H-cluster radical SAM maturase HydG [Candidatus Formimonas warabiya]
MNKSYAADFIDESKIQQLLSETAHISKSEVKEIIAKAKEAKGLTTREVAALIQLEDEKLLEEMFNAALEIKQRIYGKRIVLFAPLYLSSYCINNCVYCGYRCANKGERKKLSMDEIREEVEALEQLGHKRLMLDMGEDPQNAPIEYVVEAMKTIYETMKDNGAIRRINVQIAATTVEDYLKLKQAGIGTYILFQETFHRQTYAKIHPSGPKRDYDWHTTAMDRAMEGGIDDVGMGVLFGLYDYRFEVVALMLGIRHLEEKFGVGPHTISFPRMREAEGVDLSTFPYLVNDDQFKKIVAVLRLAVPYTGMILSTREKPDYRDEVVDLGISQMSAGSCVGIGGYKAQLENLKRGTEEYEDLHSAQFEVADHRSPDQILRHLCEAGYIPSYCTACYRKGRTGDRFMSLAKTGEIQNVCQPNAILTFKEYLMDYASPETREIGEQAIKEHLEMITNPKIKQMTIDELKKIEVGTRDLYF